MHTSQFSELFENRDIVLIGGGPRIELPEDLEDVMIIGANQHRQGDMPFTGMVCCACEPAHDHLWTPGMEFLAVPTQSTYRERYIEAARKKKVRSIIDYPVEMTMPEPECKSYQDEWAHSLIRRLKCRPFTGIFAMEWLLKFPFRRLHLTGFTFYYDTQRQAFPIRKSQHHIRQQMEYVKEHYMNDSRISGDSFLEVIMYEGVKWPDYSLSYFDTASRVTDVDDKDHKTVWAEVPYSKWVEQQEQKNACCNY